MGKRVVCPICGGRLQFEDLQQRSRINKINLDGTLSKRTTFGAEGSIECTFISCTQCSFIAGDMTRDWDFQFACDSKDRIEIYDKRKSIIRYR